LLSPAQPSWAQHAPRYSWTQLPPWIAAPGSLPCRTAPDLFFAEHPDDLEQAKELCSGCPVRAACLEGALERGEPCGVWGGQLLDRGRIAGAKRARGRPRKAAA
jgi:WhiB family transcriptional regulator, redox-sensing transcriptional regulator